MALTIPLPRHLFRSDPQVVCTSDGFEVTARTYPTGIQSLTIRSSRGHVEVLPFMGQIIWDAEFDGVSLRMDNMFDQPRPAASIEDTYGCFAFHAGLLAAGCPAPEDTHPLHGEFACMALDTAELVADGDQLTVRSYGEYVKGFGHHYLAAPSVTLTADASTFDIAMTVTNLSAYADMPLQYMCHMNYAFSPGARFTQSIPDDAFRLRDTVPAHVTPTPAWEQVNEELRGGRRDPQSLQGAEDYDPEIVFFADDLPHYGEDLIFRMDAPNGGQFVTAFASSEFPTATRWILHNPDQKVAAFVLPGTSRPEGFLAADRAGTLIRLRAGETRTFRVRTGLESSPADCLSKES